MSRHADPVPVPVSREPEVYRGMTAAELEAEYNLIALRPDFQQAIVGPWMRRSADFRARADGRIGLGFSEDPRDLIDLFGAGRDAALLVFLHGGYWQRGTKEMYSFIAEPFVAAGVGVAVLDYNLCPGVRISEIAPQVRRALVWLWRNEAGHRYCRDRIVLTGASAGGHLTAMALTTDWRKESGDLPDDLIKAAVPISGIYDLEPIRYTSINDAVGMDEAEARAQSPIHLGQPRPVPQLVAVGGTETAEFLRQSDAYAEKLRTEGMPAERYDEPGVDHFDVLNRWTSPDSDFFAKTMRLIREATQARGGAGDRS